MSINAQTPLVWGSSLENSAVGLGCQWDTRPASWHPGKPGTPAVLKESNAKSCQGLDVHNVIPYTEIHERGA